MIATLAANPRIVCANVQSLDTSYGLHGHKAMIYSVRFVALSIMEVSGIARTPVPSMNEVEFSSQTLAKFRPVGFVPVAAGAYVEVAEHH